MTVHDWSAVKGILADALEREPGERAAFLDDACGSDAALRDRIEELLALEDDAAATLEKPPVETRAPERIGRYAITRVIAAGGMGVVYEARQERPSRVVALKVVREGIVSPKALRRFEHESQILARLHHPNIAQVYEAGTHDDGRGAVPFFAMEYVASARSLTEHAYEKKLTTTERLRLFVKVCDAVQHGHQSGVIHRDLKPSNILVDSRGEPKIIDFGVARSTDSDIAVTTMQTDVGQLIGTLQYMSPEQCEADPLALDTRSDVYALGVVLYELLCERLPYDVTNAAVYDAARIVRETSPARPSTVDRTLRGDIETIALKALEKDRTRRYQAAAELAADIQRYLDREPIVARPPSLVYQLSMLARRHRAAFAAVAAIAVVLVIATFVSVIFGVNANMQREEATWRLYVSNLAAAQALIEDGALATARARLEQSPERYRAWEWHYLRARAAKQELHTITAHDGEGRAAAFSPNGLHLVTGSTDGALIVWDTSSRREVMRLEYGEGGVLCAVYTPDGKHIISSHANNDFGMRVWDAETGREIARWETADWVRRMAIGPDGRLAVGYADRLDHDSAEIVDPMTGEQLVELPGWFGYTSAIAFSPDGKLVATSGQDETFIRLWDATTGAQLRTCGESDGIEEHEGHENEIWSVAFSPDGALLASAGWDHVVKLWDVTTGAHVADLIGHEDGVYGVEFSADGTRLASTSWDRTVRLWDVDSREEVDRYVGHESLVWGATFDPEGELLVSYSNDRTIRVWEVDRFAGVPAMVRGGAISRFRPLLSPHSRFVATAGGDRSIRIWNWNGEQLASLPGHQGSPVAVRCSPDGRWIATVGHGDYVVRIWDAETGACVRRLPRLGSMYDFEFSPDGDTIATASWRVTKLWDVETAELLAQPPAAPRTVRSLAFSPDGRFLAIGSEDGLLRLWDVDAETILWRSSDHDGHVYDLAYSPSGELLASASGDNTIRLWDTSTPERPETVATLEGHSSDVEAVTFSDDGTRLASGAKDRTVRLWDVVRGEEVLSLSGNRDDVMKVVFSQDGSRLLSVSREQSFPGLIWDTVPVHERVESWRAARLSAEDLALRESYESRTPVTLASHGDKVNSLAFSSDGALLVSASNDHTIKVHETATRSVRLVLDGHEEAVQCAVFSPDDTLIASGSVDRTIRLWDTRTGEPRRTISVEASGVSCLVFSPDGSRIYSSHRRDGSIRVCDVVSGDLLHQWAIAPDIPRWIAISPNGSALAVAVYSDDLKSGSVMLVDASSGQPIVELAGQSGGLMNAVAFSPDGTLLASAGDDSAILISDVNTGEVVARLTGPDRRVWSLAFSPDGTRLVSSSLDGLVRIWNMEESPPRRLLALPGHPDRIYPVDWAGPDGRWIASGAADGSVMLWDFERALAGVR